MEAIIRVTKKILRLLILVYQAVLGPWLQNHCRFTPTCSNYALEALENYGLFKALLLITKRLLRCHPFAKGGVDLVEIKVNKKNG